MENGHEIRYLVRKGPVQGRVTFRSSQGINDVRIIFTGYTGC